MGGGGKGKKGQGKDAGVFELTKYLNQVVQVKFTGGREVKGKLKGYDPATNIVLDEAEEYKRDPKDPTKTLEETRVLGLVVCRGPAVMLISPIPTLVPEEEIAAMAGGGA